MLHAIIFVTGAAILALELLASRIMTPYFGVSLYIWSGILSITLISLAAGYWHGGRLASGKSGRAPPPEKLAFLFALMPALASLAIVAACLLYPYLFYRLARLDLVLGASFKPDQIIPGPAAGFDELVDLCLERGPVSVLGRLQNWQQEQSHNADRNVSTGNEQFVSGEIGRDPSACQKHADNEHLGTACEPSAPRR